MDLSGLRLLICQRTGIDNQGSLLLDAEDPPDAWADFLGGVDLDWARAKREASNKLRQLEAGVAAAVGVRMLFTAAPFLVTHDYRCSPAMNSASLQIDALPPTWSDAQTAAALAVDPRVWLQVSIACKRCSTLGCWTGM